MITFVIPFAVDESIIEAEVWMLRSAAATNRQEHEPCEQSQRANDKLGHRSAAIFRRETVRISMNVRLIEG